MDGDDDAESFRQLLHIDKKAREVIALNDEQIRRYVINTRNTLYERTHKDIKRVLGDALKTGRVDAERIGHVSETANCVKLQAHQYSP